MDGCGIFAVFCSAGSYVYNVATSLVSTVWNDVSAGGSFVYNNIVQPTTNFPSMNVIEPAANFVITNVVQPVTNAIVKPIVNSVITPLAKLPVSPDRALYSTVTNTGSVGSGAVRVPTAIMPPNLARRTGTDPFGDLVKNVLNGVNTMGACAQTAIGAGMIALGVGGIAAAMVGATDPEDPWTLNQVHETVTGGVVVISAGVTVMSIGIDNLVFGTDQNPCWQI